MKYNLFNNSEVDEIALAFNSENTIYENTINKAIDNLIELFELGNICTSTNYNICDYYLARFSIREKSITINYKYIVSQLKKISNNQIFINLNLYRIILHEIKHALQHKIIISKDVNIYQIFDYEFNTLLNLSAIKPSEINADLESSYVVYNMFEKTHEEYIKQLLFTYNIIKKSYNKKHTVLDFCKENDINYNNICNNFLEELLYGMYNDLTDDMIVKVLEK